MKTVNIIFSAVAVVILSSCSGTGSYKLADDKEFFINSVSSSKGVEAIQTTLAELGFTMEGEVTEGLGGLYAVYTAPTLTIAQFNKLTGGLFKELPSRIDLAATGNANGGFRVFLSWYRGGAVKGATIGLNDMSQAIPEDAAEIDRRLSVMFPLSKVSNSFMGYRTYYFENGAGCYYYGGYVCELSLDNK